MRQYRQDVLEQQFNVFDSTPVGLAVAFVRIAFVTLGGTFARAWTKTPSRNLFALAGMHHLHILEIARSNKRLGPFGILRSEKHSGASPPGGLIWTEAFLP